MDLVLIGGGEFGQLIASALHRSHNVTVLDQDEQHASAFETLDVRFLRGNGADPDDLAEAGAATADALIACTGNDDVNVLACLAGKGLGATRTLAFVSRQRYLDAFSREGAMTNVGLSIDRVLWPQRILARQIAGIVRVPRALDSASFADDRLHMLESRLEPDDPFVGETLAEADTAGHALADFVRTSVGMTREFGIRKDGRWGKTLFAIRANASASLEEFFKHVEKTFSRAVPHPGKGHRGMARPEPLPRADRIERAEADLRFLAISGEWASQAAVGGAQKHVADMVRDELDECARALLEILRTAEGDAAELAAEGLELIVRYMRAFKDEENAELIHRRAVAVRANAA